eukprot:UN03382
MEMECDNLETLIFNAEPLPLKSLHVDNKNEQKNEDQEEEDLSDIYRVTNGFNQKLLNLGAEIRENYYNGICLKVESLKNGLYLWNTAGLIPMLTNFVSWMNEANNDIQNLLNRFNSMIELFNRFACIYKQQCISLTKMRSENAKLRKENQFLTSQMLHIQSRKKECKSNVKSNNVQTITIRKVIGVSKPKASLSTLSSIASTTAQ